MTQPRYVRAGQTTMMQTRTYRGEYRLRPSALVDQALEYALARAAQLTGVELHEFNILPNHMHIVSTDSEADRPEFMRIFLSLSARVLNKLHQERDQVFSQRRYTDPVLLTEEAVFERLIYTLTNPVKHGYVRYLRDWNGVTSWELEYGVPKQVPRPEGIFNSPGMPETIDLRITRPPGLAPNLSDADLRARVRLASLEREKALRGQAKREGRSFLGMSRVRRLSRNDAPQYARARTGSSAQIRPKVAGGTHEQRAELLQRIRDFVTAHTRASAALRSGKRDVQFPAGTYAMRRLGMRSLPP